MIRVQLVVTGRSERAALHTSLERACRVFAPRGEFVFLEPQYVDSFTSGSRALTPPLPDDPVKKDPARKLADAVIAALVDGRRKNERADYAFAVDDLEVPNAANADGVVTYFATHMERARPLREQPGRPEPEAEGTRAILLPSARSHARSVLLRVDHRSRGRRSRSS